ncbi:hypothetical protein R3I94_015058 [Phoxinus phoxinus]
MTNTNFLESRDGTCVITTTHLGIDPNFCSHRVRSGTDPGNVTRSPTRDRCLTCLRSHRRHSGNFPGSTPCVKGALETLDIETYPAIQQWQPWRGRSSSALQPLTLYLICTKRGKKIKNELEQKNIIMDAENVISVKRHLIAM